MMTQSKPWFSELRAQSPRLRAEETSGFERLRLLKSTKFKNDVYLRDTCLSNQGKRRSIFLALALLRHLGLSNGDRILNCVKSEDFSISNEQNSIKMVYLRGSCLSRCTLFRILTAQASQVTVNSLALSLSFFLSL